MKKNLLLLPLALFLCKPISSDAQTITSDKHLNNNPLEVHVDIHYMPGLRESWRGTDFSYSDDLKAYSLRVSLLYRFLPRLKAGIGIGQEHYEVLGGNTCPIFLTAEYAPLKKDLKPFLFTNIGYSYKSDDMVPGWLYEIGIGYKYMFKKHFGMKVEAGYNFKTFEYSLIYKEAYNMNRHSVTLGVGLIF